LAESKNLCTNISSRPLIFAAMKSKPPIADESSFWFLEVGECCLVSAIWSNQVLHTNSHTGKRLSLDMKGSWAIFSVTSSYADQNSSGTAASLLSVKLPMFLPARPTSHLALFVCYDQFRTKIFIAVYRQAGHRCFIRINEIYFCLFHCLSAFIYT